MGGIARMTWRLGGVSVVYILTRFASALASDSPAADTQTIREAFQRVAPSVVSIRARSRDVMPGAQMRFTEVGSGVLISAGGMVLTAAHLVYAMDEISVHFSTGETVSARIVTSETAPREVSLLQIDRVPSGATVSPMAESRTVRTGDEAFVVSAPYGRSHTLSVGSIKARQPLNTVMPLVDLFVSDENLNAFNWGTPMFNRKGALIGIISQDILSDNRREQPDFVVTLTAVTLPEPAIPAASPR